MSKNKNRRYPGPDDENDLPVNMVNEPAQAFSNTYRFDIILPNASNKPESQLTGFEKVHIVRDGVSKSDLELLKRKTALDYTMLAKALSVTRATLINKKKNEKFNAGLSEKILGMADLYSYGFEVFEDEDRFTQWMSKPNKALGGQAPYDLIDNQFGREEVKNLIGRIDYGVYS
jgi:putative toxin-antitoxin system antitoxin component (TIGR02293 family)